MLGRGIIAAQAALLIALAAWCRVTSLGTAPAPAGDEAFFGVQAERLIRGDSISSRTGSGKAVDPIYTLVEAPLHVLLPPSYTVERLPAAIFGLAAIGLAYPIGRRMLDPAAAAIATGLLACLPIAIIYSRLGWEYSEVPALVLLILQFASRRDRGLGTEVALMVAYLACVHESPTVVFLAPLIVGLRLVVALGPAGGEARTGRRPALLSAGAIVAATVVIGLLKRNNPTTRWVYSTYRFGGVDWPRFLGLYLRHHLGFCQGASTEIPGWLAPAAGVGLGVLLVAGVIALVRQRRWDRLTIVGGALASAAAFHLVVGPDGFHPGMPRYGLFLVVPNVLAVACLTRALLIEPRGRLRAAGRGVQIAGIAALCWALALTYKVHYFDTFAGQAAADGESFWTIRTEAAEPMARLAAIIGEDHHATATRGFPTAVVAEDWWSFKPLEFLLARRDDLKPASVERFDLAGKALIVGNQLRAGGYVVGREGDEVDRVALAQFPAARLVTWRVQVGCHPAYVARRLDRVGSRVARGDRPDDGARR